MGRIWDRIRGRESEDRERGAALPEYVLLLVGGFTAISGGADVVGGSIDGSLNDANDGFSSPPAQVQSADDDDDQDDDAEEDDSGGGSSGGGGSSDSGGSDDSDSSSAGGGASSGPGTGTIGYWKNHPEAWPVTSMTIAGTSYTRDELIAIINMNGNKPAAMAAQLIAAELNVLIGNDSSCINSEIDDAHVWLTTYPIGTTGGAMNSAWSSGGEDIKNALDDYNNGDLDCADHRG